MTDTLPRSDPRPQPPRPLLPAIPGPADTLRAGWRWLRRMSSALLLLFAVAVASLLATFIPQEPVIPPTVRAWRAGTEGPGEALAAVFDALDLFDVFGSWWFALLVVLLFVSLTGCLLPRWAAFARVRRQPPRPARDLQRFSHRRSWTVEAPPAEVLDRVAGALRGYRRARHGDQVAAERGRAREGGSLVFHTSFYLLLIGIVLGQGFGFTGQVDLVEGQAFADTPVGYDATAAGRFWGGHDHGGHVTRLDDFTVTYTGDGFVPDEFVSDLTVLEGGAAVTSGESRVNHPFRHAGLRYYQRAFGFAPRVRLAPPGGAPLFEEAVILRPLGPVWQGRGKVALGNAARGFPQIGLELVFVPDVQLRPDGTFEVRSPEPNDPRLVASLYVDDDLGLDRPEPLSRLQWAEDQLADEVMLTPGDTSQLLGGALEITFVDLPMWSGLQVSHQPFRWLLLTAAALMLVGLVASLYAYRRRLWVEAVGEGPTTVVLAGVAQQRREHFTVEFDAVAQRLDHLLTPKEPARDDR